MGTVELFSLLFISVFVSNVVFSGAVGLDHIERFTREPRRAVVFGVSVTVVTIVSRLISYPIFSLIFPNAPRVIYVTAAMLIPLVVTVLISFSPRVLPQAEKLTDMTRGLMPEAAYNAASVGILMSLRGTSVGFVTDMVTCLFMCFAVMISYMIFVVLRRDMREYTMARPIIGAPAMILLAALISMILSGYADMGFGL